MELYGADRAMITHPVIKGWTLRVSREPAMHDDPPDNPPTYVGLIYLDDVFHCRIVVASVKGRQAARAEIYGQFEEWVYRFTVRDRSGDNEPCSP